MRGGRGEPWEPVSTDTSLTILPAWQPPVPAGDEAGSHSMELNFG